MIVRLSGCICLLKISTYWTNTILFSIKPALILKENLKENPSIIAKIKFYCDETTDFHDKEMPKMGSNHTFLAVISLDSALKKYENLYLQVFLKECK